MSMSISVAARLWQVSRTTIYRKRRKGALSFLETTPATIDAKEMLRAFGEPRGEEWLRARASNDAVDCATETAACLAVGEAEHMPHRTMIDEPLVTKDQRRQQTAIAAAALAAPSRPGLQASSWPLGALRSQPGSSGQ